MFSKKIMVISPMYNNKKTEKSKKFICRYKQYKNQ